MATNYVRPGDTGKKTVTAGAVSGDWDLVGDQAVVLLEDADDNDEAMCALTGVYELSVTGADNAGNAAITEGDKVYADGTDLNVDSTDGVFFGHAEGDVASGATTAIGVRLKG